MNNDTKKIFELVENLRRKVAQNMPLEYVQRHFFEFPGYVTEADKLDYIEVSADLQEACNWGLLLEPGLLELTIKSEYRCGDGHFYVLEYLSEDSSASGHGSTSCCYGIFFNTKYHYFDIGTGHFHSQNRMETSQYAGKSVADLAPYIFELTGRRYVNQRYYGL